MRRLFKKSVSQAEFINEEFKKIMRAGNADPGSLIRRRRREVALVDNITELCVFYLTQNLRLPYDFKRLFYNISIQNRRELFVRWMEEGNNELENARKK